MGARQRLESQLEGRRGQAARLEEEYSALQERLRQAEQQRDIGAQELATLQQDLEPARQERAQLESRERSLGAELAAGQQGLLAAERGLLEAESDVRLRSEEMDALRQNIEAEGLVPMDSGEVMVGDGEDASVPAWLTSREDGFEGPLPPMRGGAQVEPSRLKERMAELRRELRSLGPVNAQAQADYSESKERYDFLRAQMEDLREAEGSLQAAISELESLIRKRFQSTFKQVNREFQRYFTTFFGGGSAELVLTRPQDDGGAGIEIVAQPPGKRLGSLAMMSGGERALTAVALLFALLQANPSPFCVLDEVDAMLDEANVGRFVEELRRLAERTQFIIITHNRRTIEMADAIYGVSMGGDSTSTVLSLRLAEVGADQSTDGETD
jgi:chromosome segregation protein